MKATSLFQRKPTRISHIITSKSSGKVISKTPRRDPSRTPGRVLPKTSRRDLPRTSRRDLLRSPGRVLSRTSKRDLSKTARRNLSKTSIRNLSKTSRQNLMKTSKQYLLRTPVGNISRISGRDLLKTPGRNVSRTPGRDLSKTSKRDLPKTSRWDLLKTSRRDLSRTSRRVVSRTSRRVVSRTSRWIVPRASRMDLSRNSGRNVSRSIGRDLLRSPSSATTKASYRPASSIHAGSKFYTHYTKLSKLNTRSSTEHRVTVIHRKKTPSGMSKSKYTQQLISGVVTSQTKGLIKGTSKDEKTQSISIVMSEKKDLSVGDMSKTKYLVRAGVSVASNTSIAATQFTSSAIEQKFPPDPPEDKIALRQQQPTSVTWTWYWRDTCPPPPTSILTCKDGMGYRVRCTSPVSTRWRKYRPRKPPTVTTTWPPTITRWIKYTTAPSTTYYDEDTTSVTTTPTTPTPDDIEKLLIILDNLTYIYDTDLVMKFNKSLHEEGGYPHCPPTVPTRAPTTSTVTTEPPISYGDLTGTTVTKCFVCGMTVPGIPEWAKCADSFASDFFPTAPVDMAARGLIDSFRKHCRYLDIRNFHINGTLDKFMWGAWTGGCSVRWVDLSGVYTQRTCRNRDRPSLGRHFASKRMAMLEKALARENNSCIISPQASLVPFSRGVSLYARFHACVCTGNYCNHAERLTPLTVVQMVLFSMAERIMKCLIRIKKDIIP